MKKQNNIRRFISFLLCFVMIVSVFSMFSFANDNAAAAYAAYNCNFCGGTGCVEWLPLGTRTEPSTHEYVIFNPDGTSETKTCNVETKWGGQCLVCLACGRVLAENPYILSITHKGCGA
jgi:hypothetical protein